MTCGNALPQEYGRTEERLLTLPVRLCWFSRTTSRAETETRDRQCACAPKEMHDGCHQSNGDDPVKPGHSCLRHHQSVAPRRHFTATMGEPGGCFDEPVAVDRRIAGCR